MSHSDTKLSKTQVTEHTNVCDLCPSDYHCERLEMALKVLRAQLAAAPNPDVERELSRLKTELAAAGWGYPATQRSCALEHNAKRVIEITEELIALMRTIDAGLDPAS